MHKNDLPNIGLFWLKQDLSDFAFFHAEKEVSDANLTKGVDIFPCVSHRGSWPSVKLKIPEAENLKYNSLPRGRVEYSAKERCFVIKTGAWLTDYFREKIIDHYNLQNRAIRFDQNTFWNGRQKEKMDNGFQQCP